MQTDELIIDAIDAQVALWDYGDGDVQITIDNKDNAISAILRPADIFQIVVFFRRAVEKSRTVQDAD